MKNDNIYGRVIPYIPSHKFRKMKNAIYVVRYFIDFYKPSYAYGLATFLTYQTDTNFYEVYNPQRYVFDMEALKATISSSHRYHHSEIVSSFSIVVLKKS